MRLFSPFIQKYILPAILVLAAGILWGSPAITARSAPVRVELGVPHIGQRFQPPDPGGDVGTFDCVAASTAMVLQYVQNQGKVSGAHTDYVTVRKEFRSYTRNPNSGLSAGLIGVVASKLTNQALSSDFMVLPESKWTDAVEKELEAGFPLVAVVGNWNLLAAHWSGSYAHSIVINGIDDQNVYYIDPWDGHSYSLSIVDFGTAWKFRRNSGDTILGANIFRLAGPHEVPATAVPPTQAPSENNPPDKPSLVRPDDWFETREESVSLCTLGHGDPDPNDRAAQYFFQIFESAQLWDSGWVNDSCVNTTPLGAYIYQWRVKVRDTHNAESEWSAPRHFSIRSSSGEESTPSSSSPASPRLITPQDGATFALTDAVIFEWDASAGTEEYLVEITGKKTGARNSGWIKETYFHGGSQSTVSENYLWSVKARNHAGESNWSETWKFRVEKDAQPFPSCTPTEAPELVPTDEPPTQQDITKPDGDYTSPSAGETVACNVHLAAWASDDMSGVKEVHFTAKVNGEWQLVHKTTSEPYDYDWDICGSGAPDGDIELGLDVYDNAGNEFNLNIKHANPHIRKAEPTPKNPSPAPVSGNIARQARREPDGAVSGNAFDGNTRTFWNSGLGHAFSLKLSWDQSVGLNRIIVYDRPQNSPDNNQINRMRVILSNGWSQEFDMRSQSDRCIDIMLVDALQINSVTLVAVDASGDNGLSEVEIWSGEKTGGSGCRNRGSLP